MCFLESGNETGPISSERAVDIFAILSNGYVQAVIAELSLTKCADTRVGDEFIRGISGGELATAIIYFYYCQCHCCYLAARCI